MLFYRNSVSPYNSHQEYIIERESIQQHYKAGDMEEFTIDVESLIRTPGIIPFCTIIYLSVTWSTFYRDYCCVCPHYM